MADRAKAARAKGTYDTDALAALEMIEDISKFINEHPKVKTRWMELDLEHFIT